MRPALYSERLFWFTGTAMYSHSPWHLPMWPDHVGLSLLVLRLEKQLAFVEEECFSLLDLHLTFLQSFDGLNSLLGHQVWCLLSSTGFSLPAPGGMVNIPMPCHLLSLL